MAKSREARRIRLPVVALHAVERVYAKIPSPHCKGLCQAECRGILMTPLEYDRILAHVGRKPVSAEGASGPCPHLTAEGACGVYPVRPLICRLYGSIAGLPCPHGCEPDGGLLPDSAGQEMIQELMRINFELYGVREGVVRFATASARVGKNPHTGA